ncbi:hypothetical protein RCL_jg23414.t1 [Rhizophagus clarus]|uniref:Uncharacterized protein n=1 Tax=Rhizophagus clarus TaxID=94130 RepID=A0A8H3QHA8_9GLOM|nr:hypothetical protein RCL_jg23414.t1 [Rhizophagus clarus]
MGKPTINVDIIATVFCESGPLINIVLSELVGQDNSSPIMQKNPTLLSKTKKSEIIKFTCQLPYSRASKIKMVLNPFLNEKASILMGADFEQVLKGEDKVIKSLYTYRYICYRSKMSPHGFLP